MRDMKHCKCNPMINTTGLCNPPKMITIAYFMLYIFHRNEKLKLYIYNDLINIYFLKADSLMSGDGGLCSQLLGTDRGRP